MHSTARVRAFSLIEVVIATGLAAGAVLVIIGLLGQQSRQVRDADDQIVAAQLADGIRVELMRLARQQGFDVLAASIPVMSGAADEGLLLVADRAGMGLRPLIPSDPTGGRYFLVEIRRYPGGPLAYDPAGAALAVAVRVTWPYQPQPGGSTTVAASDRGRFDFALAINR
jgi:type II secretory pathway pseudopilin PulG